MSEAPIRTSGLHGGLRLDAHKERSTAAPIRIAAIPPLLVLPLDQHSGASARPLVKPGEQVRCGQPIGEPAGDVSAWLHAPTSGRVLAIEQRPAPQHLGAPTLSIVLESDGRDATFDSNTPFREFEQHAPAALLQHIALAGVVGLGGGAFPLAAKLATAARAQSLHLLLNGAECEPYISCDDMLMRERAADVVHGARILMHALGAARCTIAIEQEQTDDAEQAMRAAVAAAHDERLALQVVPNIYPAGGERQLIATVFGFEAPSHGLPADVGVLCHNVGTAAAVAQWIRDGRPLISRICTVTGDGVQQAGNLEARIGTSMAALIAECGGYTERVARLIMGGSMMGHPLPHDELPIIKASNCIIAASALDLHPRDRELPCIRCGDCADACPAILLPQQLHWFARISDMDALEAHGLLDCIECGCCDYVCPSQIPLVERFRDMKPLLARRLAERAEAKAARTRFEVRNERLERLAAEQRTALAKRRRGRTASEPPE